MTEWILTVASALFILAGLGVIAVALFGVFRFKFVVDRMQSAAIVDTLGVMLVLIGLMLASPSVSYVLKLLVILAALWIGSPLTSHLLSRMELYTDESAPDFVAGLSEEQGLLGPEEKEDRDGLS